MSSTGSGDLKFLADRVRRIEGSLEKHVEWKGKANSDIDHALACLSTLEEKIDKRAETLEEKIEGRAKTKVIVSTIAIGMAFATLIIGIMFRSIMTNTRDIRYEVQEMQKDITELQVQVGKIETTLETRKEQMRKLLDEVP